jgi:hypothetical protein
VGSSEATAIVGSSWYESNCAGRCRRVCQAAGSRPPMPSTTSRHPKAVSAESLPPSTELHRHGRRRRVRRGAACRRIQRVASKTLSSWPPSCRTTASESGESPPRHCDNELKELCAPVSSRPHPAPYLPSGNRSNFGQSILSEYSVIGRAIQ